MAKRKVEIGETRVAGKGNDGNTYGVTTITTKGEGNKVHRKKPCPTCPWRKDAQIGRFPAQAYRESAPTAYDGALTSFACHESGGEKPATCAGFLLANAGHNIGVRMALFSGKLNIDGLNARGIPLYKSYREMAIANGVAPDDPSIVWCRGNKEGPPAFRKKFPAPGHVAPGTLHEKGEALKMLGVQPVATPVPPEREQDG